MRRALQRVRVLPTAILVIVTILVFAAQAHVYAGSQKSELEKQIRDSVLREYHALQEKITCYKGQCLPFKERQHHKAIAGCFDVSRNGSIILRTYGADWGWRDLGSTKEKALYWCNKDRSEYDLNCECVITSVNEKSVFEVPPSLLKKAEAQREAAAAAMAASPAKVESVEDDAREDEKRAAAEREAQQLRQEIEEARREKERLQAKPRAADELARKLADEQARQKRLRQQTEADRIVAEERARKLAEETARQDRMAAATQDQTQKELE